MRLGYGRVSTRDQHVDEQRDALQAAGCEVVFVDSASGKLPFLERPQIQLAFIGLDSSYRRNTGSFSWISVKHGVVRLGCPS